MLYTRINPFIQVQKYLWMANESNISWAMIHAAIASVARTTIIPMQDILGLGSDARMNTPATQVIHLVLPFIYYP